MLRFIYSSQSLCKRFLDMKVASFNAQRFGLRKAQDRDVLSALIKVKTKTVMWAAAANLDRKDNNACLSDWYLCGSHKKMNDNYVSGMATIC